MEFLEAVFSVTTPMFLSGADQKEAELRVPSIKGALRFWWRALAYYEVQGNIKELRENEADIFGDTKRQSNILLSIGNNKNICERNTKEQFQWKVSDWRSYVGYGLTEKASRKYIEPASSMIYLNVHERKLTQDQRGSVVRAIKVMGLFGGLGARSRKGWGSLTLKTLEGWNSKWKQPENEDDFKNNAKDILAIDKLEDGDELHSYTSISTKAIFEVGKKQSLEEAYKYLGNEYKKAVTSCAIKKDREQFGLPRASNNKRRASPLFLHVHQCPDGNAFPVALYLPSIFLSDKEDIPGNGEAIKSLLTKVRGESNNG